MILKIVSIDMAGYNGRNHHPAKSDVGLLVVPVKMESWAYGDEVAMLRPSGLSAAGRAAVKAELANSDDMSAGIVNCWTCATEDGRLLELMDHEVELFRS